MAAIEVRSLYPEATKLTKVLMIGLDAAEPSLIEKWRDDLPNLSRIMREGTYGRMRSSDPPVSIPAWNCLCTGKNPGKIGTYDFIYRESGGWKIKFVNSTVVRARSLWKILSMKGKRVVVIAVPSTFPPEEVNGVMVCGIPLPVDRGKPVGIYTYPSELGEEIDRLVGGYEYAYAFNLPKDFVVSDTSWSPPAQGDNMENFLLRTVQKELQVAKHLMNSIDWDFFMVVFRELDLFGHVRWKNAGEPQSESSHSMKRFYTRMDEIVGELLGLVKDDTLVFVVSDHGFGPVQERFFVNEFLQRIGMLKVKGTKRLQLRVAQNLKLGPRELRHFLLRLRLQWLANLVPRKFQRMIRSIDQFQSNVGWIDWSRTKAYSYGGTGNAGRIFLNVKGREPEGIVELGSEYEQTREFITKKLQELTHPKTGARRVDAVFKREDIYSGEFIKEAPDLLFYLDGHRCVTSSRVGSRSLFMDERLLSGTHRPYGIFMAYGNGVRKGASVGPTICDVAPTVMHVMGLPVPDDMDGRPILDILEPDSEIFRRPVSYEKLLGATTEIFEWSPEEEKKVEEQLRGLGYLG